ncbi:hypothetical protein L1987_81323 [Smallanthus sonchifolius]|uniref:Uncharacterized protein n=1 Tax=Smallanthus sonchifolius TaxID=185202 RepID=A0ACB8YQQ7_9ASTR|nr:hypothetical protein L1987_81323 [Smallanthus sonchifolius]
MWKAFSEFGTVSDAYVAKKKDARGNVFGFVRFKGVSNVNGLLSEMSNVKNFEAKLSVSLAKYDRNSGINRKWVDCRAKLFSDLSAIPRARYGTVCSGEARDIETLCNCRVMLDAGGYKVAEILYVEGLKVMLVFKDDNQALEFVQVKDRVWTKFLLSANLWSGQFRRISSLKVVGVPFQLRDKNTFDKVGELFGKIIFPSEFTWSDVDISSGVCYVLTTSGARIEEEVNLIWKNESHSIWVVEELNSWVPSFGGSNLQDTRQAVWMQSPRMVISIIWAILIWGNLSHLGLINKWATPPIPFNSRSRKRPRRAGSSQEYNSNCNSGESVPDLNSPCPNLAVPVSRFPIPDTVISLSGDGVVDEVVPDSMAVGVGDGNLDETELSFKVEETVRVRACHLQERRDQVRSLIKGDGVCNVHP